MVTFFWVLKFSYFLLGVVRHTASVTVAGEGQLVRDEAGEVVIVLDSDDAESDMDITDTGSEESSNIFSPEVVIGVPSDDESEDEDVGTPVSEASNADNMEVRSLAEESITVLQNCIVPWLARRGMEGEWFPRVAGAFKLLRAKVIRGEWESIDEEEFNWCLDGVVDRCLARSSMENLPDNIRTKRAHIPDSFDEGVVRGRRSVASGHGGF